MEVLCYALASALLVLTGAVVSGGLSLPRRLPRENTAEAVPDDALSRDIAALRSGADMSAIAITSAPSVCTTVCAATRPSTSADSGRGCACSRSIR